MAYPINIVMNDRIWYDSRIIDSDQVVFQNVNYATGDLRSVNVVRQRFIQDWARRIIPNSVRQGIGLTDPAGANDDIVITQGYAIIGGRFLEIPTGTWSAPTGAVGGGSISTGLNYLMIRVTPETEGDARDPALESGAMVGVLVSAYTSKSHDDLILAKFNYNGTIIDQFVDYTAEQEWQVNVISPPAARPGLTTASTEEILLRAGALERINIMNIETDKVRFYLNTVFDDQVASTEVKLINKSGQMQISNIGETGLLGLTMLELYTGTTDAADSLRIDSSGNLSNIGTINSRTMGGNTATDLVDVDSVQTITNKTLTAPIVTIGTFATPLLTTPHIVDANTEKYTFAVSDLTADRQITLPLLISNDTFVFEDHIQSLDNKTLTANTLITSFYQDSVGGSNVLTIPATTDTLVGKATIDELSNKTLAVLEFLESGGTPTQTYTITGQALSANRILTIPTAVADTFMMLGVVNAMTSGSTLSFAGDSDFLLSPGQWTGAQHDHTANNDGGVLSITSATTGTLTVNKGGTGTTSIGAYDLVVGNSAGTAYTAIGSPVSGQLLRSDASATPVWDTNNISLTLTNDVTGTINTNMTIDGDWSLSLSATVTDNTHNHLITQGGANILQVNPSAAWTTGSGIGTVNHSSGWIWFEANNSGDYVDIPLPITYFNQTVTNVKIRAKSTVNTKSVVLQIRKVYDNQTGLTFTNSISTGFGTTWIYTDITENWTNTVDRDLPILRITANDNDVGDIYIGAIQITYV